MTEYEQKLQKAYKNESINQVQKSDLSAGSVLPAGLSFS